MLTREDFANRRQRLMQQMGPDSVGILIAPNEQIRNGDTHYPYRPHSDFYYLTGFAEPEAVMILRPGAKGEEYILFNRPNDKTAEIWNGRRAGQKGACDSYGANQSYPFQQFLELLPSLLQGYKKLYYDTGYQTEQDERILRLLQHARDSKRTLSSYPSEIIAFAPLIHELRLFKSPIEIELMRRAAEITGKGHVRAMQVCKPGMMEYQLEAELIYEFINNGARELAYPCIVGSGANSCILHYTENKYQLEKGDLVLIDAGCEYDYYASDITRTFPVSGKFSHEQRLIYDIVLQAQLIGIEKVKPGNTWEIVQKAIAEFVTDSLIKLDILQGNLKQLIKDRAYQAYYLHQPGHWLGMDVHEVGRYQIKGKQRPFEAGMALTMEPGIYLAADDKLDKEWWNIGVRIEDDILVTEKGCEVLSDKIPKTADEIEAIMASR